MERTSTLNVIRTFWALGPYRAVGIKETCLFALPLSKVTINYCDWPFLIHTFINAVLLHDGLELA